MVRLQRFFAQDAINYAKLVMIDSEQQPVPNEVCLAYREHQFLPKKVQVFIDYYQPNATDMSL